MYGKLNSSFIYHHHSFRTTETVFSIEFLNIGSAKISSQVKAENLNRISLKFVTIITIFYLKYKKNKEVVYKNEYQQIRLY